MTDHVPPNEQETAPPSRSYRDASGRLWTVEITINDLRRVRSLTGVNLWEAFHDGGKLLSKLADDVILLVDVLYALCRPEAERIGVDDEQFGRRLHGEAIEQATEALLWCLADFTPNKEARAINQDRVRAMYHAGAALRSQAREQVSRIMSSAGGSSPPRASGTPTGSPASSASTPAPSPSPSSK